MGSSVTWFTAINDASLARHMDRLFKARAAVVFNAMSLRAIARGGLSLDQVHTDTTSRLLWGDYKLVDKDAVRITFGLIRFTLSAEIRCAAARCSYVIVTEVFL